MPKPRGRRISNGARDKQSQDKHTRNTFERAHTKSQAHKTHAQETHIWKHTE